MGGFSVKLDLASVLPYLEEKTSGLLPIRRYDILAFVEMMQVQAVLCHLRQHAVLRAEPFRHFSGIEADRPTKGNG
jgi:hypothetical protein